jgi:xylulokinase
MADPGIILCADIGTTSLKAAYIDFQGRLRAFTREPYPQDKLYQGAIEAGDWEAAFDRALGGLSAAAGDLRPGAVCISGNGPTLTPVTWDGRA